MIEQILKGGSLMFPLMLCSLVCLAVVYDRWMAFRANRRIDTRSLRTKIITRLRANDIPGAIALDVAFELACDVRWQGSLAHGLVRAWL